jgi:hypothetical protein
MMKNWEAHIFVGITTHNYLVTKYRLFGIRQAFVPMDRSFPFAMEIRSDWPELISILGKGLASLGRHGVEAIVAKWIRSSGQDNRIELSDEQKAWLERGHTVRVRVAEYHPNYFIREPPTRMVM